MNGSSWTRRSGCSPLTLPKHATSMTAASSLPASWPIWSCSGPIHNKSPSPICLAFKSTKSGSAARCGQAARASLPPRSARPRGHQCSTTASVRLGIGQDRRYLGCEEFELSGQFSHALHPPARPSLNQARIDQSERDVVITVGREVTSQPFDPLGWVSGDREPATYLRRGQFERALYVPSGECVNDGANLRVVDPMACDEFRRH